LALTNEKAKPRFVLMKKLLIIIGLLAVNTGYAQIVDSTFYGQIKAGMLKAEYDQRISETRVRIMNDEYALIPSFHKDAELIELDIESAPEAAGDFNVIEKKMLSLYEVISTKYGRANTLALVSDPETIADGNTRVISSWDVGLKHISIGARRDGDKYVAVCNIFIKGYDEKLTDRDVAREQKARVQAGTKF
jgi:hypothetical protein